MARRLELLGAELAAVRGIRSPAQGDSTHTRVRPGREPTPGTESHAVATIPAPGRHAARGRLTLGTAQLAVVAMLVLAGLGVAAWWLLDGGGTEVAAPRRGRRPTW